MSAATASPSDPVMESLRRFEDRSLWKVIERVPIWDEHDDVETGPDGKERLVRYDQPRLEWIAANCNRREMTSGDLATITCGHVLRDQYDDQGNLVKKAKEKDQPDDFGFVRNYQVGRFGPAQKLGILADFWYRLETWDEAKKYQRRSVDFWKAEGIFDPIAVLKRTPARDLGVVSYDRKDRPGEHRLYEMDEASYPEEPVSHPTGQPQAQAQPHPSSPAADAVPASQLVDQRLIAMLLAELRKDPVYQFACKLHEQSQASPEQNDGASAGGAAPAAPSATSVNTPAGVGGKNKKPEQPEQKEMSATATPTTTPVAPTAPAATPAPAPAATLPPVTAPAVTGESDAVRMAREQAAIQAAQYERQFNDVKAENTALRTELASLRTEVTRSARERDLVQMEAEGYRFNRAKVLDSVATLTAEQYQRWQADARENYTRTPAGQPPVPVATTTTNEDAERARAEAARKGQPEQFSKDDRERALRMTEERKISYDAAVAEIKAEKAKAAAAK